MIKTKIAAMAMQGILSNSAAFASLGKLAHETDREFEDVIAELAIDAANALIRELNINGNQ